MQVDFDHQVMLFEEWLKERSLLGYVAKVEDAPQYLGLDDVVMPKSSIARCPPAFASPTPVVGKRGGTAHTSILCGIL